MVYCLDPEARVTYSRVIDAEVALGMPKVKAVQALSELVRDNELREDVRPDEMAVYIRMGTEARP